MTSPPPPFIAQHPSNIPLFPGSGGGGKEQPILIPKLPTLGRGSFTYIPMVPSWESGEGGVLFIRGRVRKLPAPALNPLRTVGTVEAKLRLGQEMSH